MYSVLTWTLYRQKSHKTISHFFTSYWICCTRSTNRQVPLFFSFPLLIPFITLNIPRSGLMNSTAQQVHKYLKHKNMYVTYTNKSCNKYLSSSFPINYIVVVVVVIVYMYMRISTGPCNNNPQEFELFNDKCTAYFLVLFTSCRQRHLRLERNVRKQSREKYEILRKWHDITYQYRVICFYQRKSVIIIVKVKGTWVSCCWKCKRRSCWSVP